MAGTSKAIKEVNHPQPLHHVPGIRISADGRIYINEILANKIAIGPGAQIDVRAGNEKVQLVVYNDKSRGYELKKDSGGRLKIQCKPLTDQLLKTLVVWTTYSVTYEISDIGKPNNRNEIIYNSIKKLK